MLELIKGVTTYCQQNFPDIMGSYLSGNTMEQGPFLNLAPESPGTTGPVFPYCTMQIFGEESDLGFINPTGSTTCVETPRMRFMFWDSNNARAMTNGEEFCRNLDTLKVLPLDGGEKCLTILRTMNLQNVPQPINRQGKRGYMAFIDYQFRTLRTLGA